MADDDDGHGEDPGGYGGGPPTIQETLSPFHGESSSGNTIRGMPSAQIQEPKITSKGEPSGDAADGRILRVVTPPPSPASHSTPVGLPSDGPTAPDGLPTLLDSSAPTLETALDDMATDPIGPPPVKGRVPEPDAPNIQISKSMEYDVRQFAELHALHAQETEHLELPPTRRPVQPPTEVVLPALKDEEPEESSDIWLMAGLVFLIFVIIGLLVAVGVGVYRRLG